MTLKKWLHSKVCKYIMVLKLKSLLCLGGREGGRERAIALDEMCCNNCCIILISLRFTTFWQIVPLLFTALVKRSHLNKVLLFFKTTEDMLNL